MQTSRSSSAADATGCGESCTRDGWRSFQSEQPDRRSSSFVPHGSDERRTRSLHNLLGVRKVAGRVIEAKPDHASRYLAQSRGTEDEAKWPNAGQVSVELDTQTPKRLPPSTTALKRLRVDQASRRARGKPADNSNKPRRYASLVIAPTARSHPSGKRRPLAIGLLVAWAALVVSAGPTRWRDGSEGPKRQTLTPPAAKPLTAGRASTAEAKLLSIVSGYSAAVE